MNRDVAPLTDEDVLQAHLVDAVLDVLNDQPGYLILAVLTEVVARYLSRYRADSDELEASLAKFTRLVRAWWIADHGGPFNTQ